MGLVPTGPATLARPSDMLDQTGDYSFANINVGRAVSAVSAEQQRAVESASGTTLEVSLLVAFFFLRCYAAAQMHMCRALMHCGIIFLLYACQLVVIAEDHHS